MTFLFFKDVVHGQSARQRKEEDNKDYAMNSDKAIL